MKEHNKITIIERNGTTYSEKVRCGFEESKKMLLGKRGKNGSIIDSISMDGLSVTIQGLNIPLTLSAINI